MLAGPMNNQKAGIKWLINNITIHIDYNISVSKLRSEVTSKAKLHELAGYPVRTRGCLCWASYGTRITRELYRGQVIYWVKGSVHVLF